MKLATFLRDLGEGGQVTVAGQIGPFDAADLHESEQILRCNYAEDALEMPGTAPDFSPEAALWGAQYLYCAAQLTVLRDLGGEVVAEYLKDYPGPVTPAVIYSVDLTFRYLPDLIRLAKGLAPGDVLVATLRDAARHWSFSSVGTEVAGEVNVEGIFEHPSLGAAYVDRIIRERDTRRIQSQTIHQLIRQALGQYSTVLWPDFPEFILI